MYCETSIAEANRPIPFVLEKDRLGSLGRRAVERGAQARAFHWKDRFAVELGRLLRAANLHDGRPNVNQVAQLLVHRAVARLGMPAGQCAVSVVESPPSCVSG